MQDRLAELANLAYHLEAQIDSLLDEIHPSDTIALQLEPLMLKSGEIGAAIDLILKSK